MKRLFSVLILISLLTATAFAQWVDDPTSNVCVSDQTGRHSQPLTASLSDGGFYVGWQIYSEGYKYYLQRYDADGNALWQEDGILISDHLSNTSTTAWDLTVDYADHCILTVTDKRNENDLNVYAYRIRPNGAMAWGADGVTLSDSPGTEPTARIAVTTESNVVFAWQDFDWGGGPPRIFVRMLDSTGVDVWETPSFNFTAPYGVCSPRVVAADNGSFIVQHMYLASRYSQSLQAMKYDNTGAALWASNTMVQNLNRLTTWSIPQLISDGEGGAFSGWYDSRDVPTNRCFVQHIESDGTCSWTTDGIQLNTNENEAQTMPSITYDPVEDVLYAFYAKTNLGQTTSGLGAQKVASDGTLLWGDGNGLTLEELSDCAVDAAECFWTGDAIINIYKKDTDVSANAEIIKAVKISPAGEHVWADGAVDLSTFNGVKLYTVAGYSSVSDVCVAIWNDERSGDDLFYTYLQNVNGDGTLGMAANPSIEITSPDNGFAFNMLPLSIEFSLVDFEMNETTPADGDGVIRVELDETVIEEYVSTSPYVFDTLEDGEHTIILTLLDGPDGSPFEPNLADTVTVTYNVPSIAITSPEDGSAFNQLPLSISFDLENFEMNETTPADGDGVISVQVDDTEIMEYAGSSPLTIDELDDGEHTIILTLIDGPDGDPFEPTYADTITVTYNIPTIAITSPEDGAEFNMLPLTIEFTVGNFVINETTPADGDGVIRIELDDADPVEYASEDAYVIEALDEGEHTLIMTLIDGPDGDPFDPTYADTISFTYNIPSIEITSPEANAELTGLPVEISFTLANFTIDTETPANGDGVIQIIIDDTPYAQVAETSSISIETLDNGEHTVELILYDGMEGDPIDPEVSDSVTFTLVVSGVGEFDSAFPTEFSLEGNYPNPFNARTTIKFGLPDNADLKMSIYSITGQKVMEYNQDAMNAGWHIVTWDASRVSSGVYFVQVRSGKEVLTHKMMLVK